MIKMSEGHKRRSHEHRKGLAGEYRWGDTGQLVLLIVFIIEMTFDLFLLKISDSWQDVFPWYLRAIIFIILFFIAGYLAQAGLKQVFREERMLIAQFGKDYEDYIKKTHKLIPYIY